MTHNARKQEIRERMKYLCKEVSAQKRKDDALKAAESLREKSYYRDASIVFSYAALSDEADTVFINEQIMRDGKDLALPKMKTPADPRGLPLCEMDFFMMDNALPLAGQLSPNAFGIAEPIEQESCVMRNKLLVIVPARALTVDGRRLGRGKGCYDRYLARLKTGCCEITLAGYCYEFQIIDDIPCDEFDIKMDYIFY